MPISNTGLGLTLTAILSNLSLSAVTIGLLPKLAKFISDFGDCSPCFSAAVTVFNNFCSAIGFSKKSNAPIRVASTAVSIVPCPDIITTGIVNWLLFAHSLSKVIPSQSGIQISSSTKSGRSCNLTARAAAAFSAS